MVGPGVQNLGRYDDVFSDHTDLRPTIVTFVGLKDDYVHEGRVLIEILEPHALPHKTQTTLSDSRSFINRSMHRSAWSVRVHLSLLIG
jgi:hypothetical protein